MNACFYGLELNRVDFVGIFIAFILLAAMLVSLIDSMWTTYNKRRTAITEWEAKARIAEAQAKEKRNE